MKQNNIIELGFIPPEQLKEINKSNTDRVLRSERDVDKAIKETLELIKITKKHYSDTDFSSDALVNFVNYVHMLQNHLLDCRDKINLVLHDLTTEVQKELNEEDKDDAK